MARVFQFNHALLPGGWAKDVQVTVDGDAIASVAHGVSEHAGERVSGIALPGLSNLHCHAFQRGMAGLAERRGPAADSFWTWREVMYRFLGRLTPDDIGAIAAFAYMQMLERGFTALAEFHYLHHDIDGRPYADLGEMAGRLAGAAAATGIGLTLLPSFYANSGFGGQPPTEGQRRFINDPDRFLRLVARCRDIVAALPGAQIGIAPHSLRAVTPETLMRVVAASGHGPIHIHIAEQQKEVADCLAWSGRRPLTWLCDEMPINARWCIIHATHLQKEETLRLAASGAVAGLCPLTEASLGDGVFDGARFLAASGRFGIGTDSNIDIDAAAELRQLEYSQRLAQRARNVMVIEGGASTGLQLYRSALAGGAQALGRGESAIAPGRRADIVVLDADHPDLACVDGDRWLDSWIFVAGRNAVRSVIAGGEIVVQEGRHRARDAITARYTQVLTRVVSN